MLPRNKEASQAGQGRGSRSNTEADRGAEKDLMDLLQQDIAGRQTSWRNAAMSIKRERKKVISLA